MRAPKFWRNDKGVAFLLKPLGSLYNHVVQLRRRMVKPVRLAVPVICVGNVVMGGSGKTVVTSHLVSLLKKQGFTPHIIMRGYKAKLKQSLRVDPGIHTPQDVGDEPLMLSDYAPVWIGKNRISSGQQAIAAGADILVMDDGFQNPTLVKDCNLLVFDAEQLIGNGYVFPAGPLREDLSQAIAQSNALILINFKEIPDWAQSSPVLQAQVVYHLPPQRGNYIAFAGIGFPEKFFMGLRQNGFNLISAVSFADHHFYSTQELKTLLAEAKHHDAQLITTAKDYIKIPDEFRQHIRQQTISLCFSDNDLLEKIISKYVK